MDFVRKYSGTLVVGSTEAPFPKYPASILDSDFNLADVAAKAAIEGKAEIEPSAKELGLRTNWTFTIIALVISLVVFMLVKKWIRRKTHR